MKSRLYRSLVRLHPRDFGQRFGDGMNAIFEESGEPAWLLADAALSLVRQWTRVTATRVILLTLLLTVPWLVMRWLIGRAEPLLPPTRSDANEGFFVMVSLIAIFIAASTTVLALAWPKIRRPQRRRSA